MDGLNTFAESLRKRIDRDAIALEVLHSLDTMQPMDVPQLRLPSAQLQKLLDLRNPVSCPEELTLELEQFANSRLARANAKGENERRLRTLLWAEQWLRAAGRAEHCLLRDFNREAWGVNESASRDIAEREAQVRAHA